MSTEVKNYIYISHLDNDPSMKLEAGQPKFWKLPCCPEKISDSMTSTFNETNALGRSAPVYTYSHSGPRKVQISLKFRIDMFEDENEDNPAATTNPGEYKLDGLVHALQAISLPKYDMTNKAVEPPLVALRLSNEIFIKGVVTSAIGIEYELPIIYGDRYAQVALSLEVTEVDPYDAQTVFKNGSFRGVVKTLRSKYMGF